MEDKKREDGEKLTTREKILYESLNLFSKRGYDGVSMREIAAAVGIKGASIYNHFKGKEDIFQEIFTEMTRRYDGFAKSMNIPMAEDEKTVQTYLNIEESTLIQMAEGLFAFFAKDEFTAMFRKLLFSEQHKSKLAAKYLREYYLEAPIQFQTTIFAGIQQKGGFAGYDPKIMALHFYSPIFYTMNEYDLGGDYEECLDQLKQHVHWFCEVYHA